MSDGEAGIIIVALSLAVVVFVGVIAPAGYGFAAFFLCVGLGTLINGLIKLAIR